MKHKKDDIIQVLKRWVVVFVLSVSFWITYCVIWYILPLPFNTWSIGILAGLASFTGCCFVNWIEK